MSSTTDFVSGDGITAVPGTLDWPPPGLEALHGSLLRVRSRAVAATAAIAPAMIWVMIGLPVGDRAVRTTLGLLIAAGLFILLTAVLLAARSLDTARRSRKLGYATRVLVEVALDRWSDTGALIAGIGAYETVRERTRTRIRSLRTLSQAMTLAAAILPLPLLCVALALALRGAADPLAVALLPLLPIMFFTVTGAIAAGYAAVLAQWDRGSDAWDPSPVTVGERALRWQEITRSRREGARASGGLLTVLGGALIGVVFFATVGFTLVTYVAYGMFLPRVFSDVLNQREGRDMMRVEMVRHWRLATDSAITRNAAGVALHNLLQRADTPAVPGVLQPAIEYDRPIYPYGMDSYWVHMYLGEALALRFGTEPARRRGPGFAKLDSLARHPPHMALQDLSILAHAADIDVTATRFQPPLTDSSLRGWRSGRGYRTVDGLQTLVIAAAAQRVRDGDVAGAEDLLKQMLSAGFLLIDRSPFMTDFNNGAEFISAAREALESIYWYNGRKAEVDALRRVNDARHHVNAYTRGSPSDYAAGEFGEIPNGQRDPLYANLDLLRRKSVYPALRWNAFQNAVPLASCGTMRRAMFGPDDFTQLMVDNAPADLRRMPSDTILANYVLNPRPSRTLPMSSRPGIRRLQRVVLAVIGDHQLRGPCAGAFTTRF